mmetsp:Transcript_105/g.206  ORF Transcript_105/g.206 Transcript_105/m.206 type:complete len:487 (-) Transcript_105:99-1559(-)|eukprot:CAMPEP_0197664574 /NCGR_PEP_ID=MMETSP1338-20131121/58719_1 /TAXON_ID=43686 ORGANISM="Pelagodinium beii, Strain RCC1491" /NCGR_SAMPLE_ID=MMETSP1338 /ASSEMBLY_ACC=CAM_ASM_000754 /LENGTH=486 /DNA_ID=CAMNT_0043243249 /DNA_START=56 /DNA_END=1516 /DNA_ORIENTATION=+
MSTPRSDRLRAGADQVLSTGQKAQRLAKAAGDNFSLDGVGEVARGGGHALNIAGGGLDALDIFAGDEEQQRRAGRNMAGRAINGGQHAVDVVDVFSGDANRRRDGAKNLVGAGLGHAANLGMQQGTNIACREAGKYALTQAAANVAVNEAGRRGAVVASGRGAAAAAAARGAAAGAGNIGKVATGATGFAVGAAGIVGQIGGEALGGALGKALGDEQAGKVVGGLGGSMGAAALAGACVGGPIGAAAAAGIAGIGFGIGKGVEAIAHVVGRCLEGGWHPTNAKQIFGKDWGHDWGRAKRKAQELVREDPKRRVSVITYWAFTGYHIKIFEMKPQTPMTFVWTDGDHNLIHEPQFMWAALASGCFLQATPDGHLKQRKLYGGAWEAFQMFPVLGYDEERFVIKTCHGGYVMVDQHGNVRQSREAGETAHFRIIPAEHGIGLQNCVTDRYLCAHKNGSCCTQPHCQAWEQFTWVDLENGYMAFRTIHA